MYECPNCGGNLKFDIASQQMACGFCGTHIDPYELKKDTDAVEGQCFEATVFTCPQCGGELFSSDSDATSFCSFCGAATILSSRISNEKRPDFIVPFKKTKEDCKQAYAQTMRKKFFAPKEISDPQFIDGFRGIYMPYWTYQLIQKGEIDLKGEKSHREGNYIITDHYNLTGDLDAYYLGYSFDASSSFYDNISEALAPYDAKELVHFTPAFLSGFYADTSDVAPDLYLNDAKELAEESTLQKIGEEKDFKEYSISDSDNKAKMESKPGTRLRKTDHVMYPVWFLSWRKKDRVAYATVNGQTGKVVADVPVDPKRCLLFALLLALPIFLMLNLFFTIKPTSLLEFSVLLLIISMVIYNKQLRSIHRRDQNLDDRGVLWKSGRMNWIKRKKPAREKKKSKGKSAVVVFLIVMVTGISLSAMSVVIMTFSSWVRILLWITAEVIIVLYSVLGIKERQSYKDVRFPLGLLAAIVVTTVAAIIAVARPVSDLYYYAGVFLVLVTVLLNLMDVLYNYNKLAMRRLPQFDKKGGDDRA